MGITEGGERVMQLRNQGMVLAEDNSKMSKSKGNVVARLRGDGHAGRDALSGGVGPVAQGLDDAAELVVLVAAVRHLRISKH